MTPSFPGLFSDPDGSERDCVVAGRSIDALSIAGLGVRAHGERVLACRIDVLGLMRGRIVQAADQGFRLDLEEGPLRRERIAARIAWHVARLEGGPDLRDGPRIVPERSAVFLRWPEGEQEGALRDVSAGGVAVDVPIRPAVGASVTVGMRRGIVVRHTEAGVGIRFVLPLRTEDVTASIVL